MLKVEQGYEPRHINRRIVLGTILVVIGGLILAFSWFITAKLRSPKAEIEKRIRMSLPTGSSDKAVNAFLNAEELEHGIYSLNDDDSGHVTAWIRNAYVRIDSGFPQPVDVIITFQFDQARRLVGHRIAERVISL